MARHKYQTDGTEKSSLILVPSVLYDLDRGDKAGVYLDLYQHPFWLILSHFAFEEEPARFET